MEAQREACAEIIDRVNSILRY